MKDYNLKMMNLHVSHLTYTGLIEELEYLKIDSDRDEVNRREV